MLNLLPYNSFNTNNDSKLIRITESVCKNLTDKQNFQLRY